MINDALRELVNMTAGLLKTEMALIAAVPAPSPAQPAAERCSQSTYEPTGLAESGTGRRIRPPATRTCERRYSLPRNRLNRVLGLDLDHKLDPAVGFAPQGGAVVGNGPR